MRWRRSSNSSNGMLLCKVFRERECMGWNWKRNVSETTKKHAEKNFLSRAHEIQYSDSKIAIYSYDKPLSHLIHICRFLQLLENEIVIFVWPSAGSVAVAFWVLASDWAIQWCCLFDPKFFRFGRTPTCDRQTDRQTDGHADRHRPIAYTALA